MFREEGIEGREVVSFLRVHVLHQGAEVRVRPEERRSLSSVNDGCSEFACLIDSKLLRDE